LREANPAFSAFLRSIGSFSAKQNAESRVDVLSQSPESLLLAHSERKIRDAFAEKRGGSAVKSGAASSGCTLDENPSRTTQQSFGVGREDITAVGSKEDEKEVEERKRRWWSEVEGRGRISVVNHRRCTE